jgi:peptidyl-prolyl cis-trans isomerase D
MVKPFNDFVFNNGIGKVGLVETAFGFHIKITDKQDGIRFSDHRPKIQASEATSDKMFTQATKFEMEAADKGFDKVVKWVLRLLSQQLSRQWMNFGSLGNQRSIVRWALKMTLK